MINDQVHVQYFRAVFNQIPLSAQLQMWIYFLNNVINPNRRDCYKILLRKCIKCDYVIKGHLNVQENAGRAATHDGLACWVMGLVCERSADQNPGEPPHYCSPYFASVGFSGSGVRVIVRDWKHYC